MPFAQVDGGFFEVHDEARVNLGECQMDRQTNNYFAYVKAAVDLEQGQPVSPSLLVSNFAAGTIKPAAIGSTELELVDTITTYNFLTHNTNALENIVDDQTPRYHEDLLVVITGGSGGGQAGIVTAIKTSGNVVDRTDDVLTVWWLTSDDGTLKNALDSSTAINFHAPWRAVLAKQNEPVIGFAQQEISEGQYFWALCKGRGMGRRHTGTGALANAIGDGMQVGEDGTDLESLLVSSGANTIRAPIATAEVALGTSSSNATFLITANADYPMSVLIPKERWT